jgi:hypothetical protein
MVTHSAQMLTSIPRCRHSKMQTKFEDKTATITFQIKPAIRAIAHRRAKQEGRSVANYIERLVLADAEQFLSQRSA